MNCHQNCPDFCSQQYSESPSNISKIPVPKSIQSFNQTTFTSTEKIQFAPPKNHEVQLKKYLPKNTVCVFFLGGGMGMSLDFSRTILNVTNFIRLKRGSKNHCFTGSKGSPPKKRWLLQKNFSQQEVGLELLKQTCTILWCWCCFFCFCFCCCISLFEFWE